MKSTKENPAEAGLELHTLNLGLLITQFIFRVVLAKSWDPKSTNRQPPSVARIFAAATRCNGAAITTDQNSRVAAIKIQ